MNKILLILLAAAISIASARSVTSKRGPVMITKSEGGGGDVCSVPFGEEMSIIKDNSGHVMVSAGCGKGWIGKGAISYVAAKAGDKSMNIDDVDIVGWLDNPSAVFVLDNNTEDIDGIELDRNFNEYLNQTVDRERTEMGNQEN
tara:strand:- start:97 stop:528 length:432 start_codon:yes stop_codon:yes gene_type:complete